MADTRRRLQAHDTPHLDTLAREHTAEGIDLVVAEYAGLLWQAGREIEGQFDRAEWNMIADACNGCFDLWDLSGGLSYTTLLTAELSDAHSLNRLGEKWLSEKPKEADKKAADLVRRLAAISPLHAAAMVAAIRWFWSDCNKIDHIEDEWWTVGFRRQRDAEAMPKNA